MMAQYQSQDKAKLRRKRTKEAIALAMQSRWEEAVNVNRSMIEIFPNDVAAYNRLGKALTELGRYAEAKQAYIGAVEINPYNRIARKNLNRLSLLEDMQLLPKDGHKLAPSLFIEEAGKAGLANLHHLAPKEVLVKMTAGDQVYLKVSGGNLIVENVSSEYLGQIEPKLGQRLIRLIEGGNRYEAAIASLGEDEGRVIIREVFQHPNQSGYPSFPSKAADGFRPYIKETLLKYELGEREPVEQGGHSADWEEGLDFFHEESPPFRDAAEMEDALEEPEV